MRFNNRKAKNFVITLYFVFASLFLSLSMMFSLVKKLIGSDKYKYYILFIVLGLALFLVHKIAKYFEYDSDGNVLVFINKGMLLSDFLNYRENRAEFPKKKLRYYKLNNYLIYKSLNIYIDSNDGKQKRLKFNVTLVSNKKLKYLNQSLGKVVKQNKVNG